ncbi:hypothetical protein Pint_35113 [Pistacia integerrima]|uniref:Uncharacterized protein n=1 Tax=Pistacia integerrima TaxID=434235 RepID=A0ACC0Y4C8_9ROSI|nr:hypothetical protein Pint_35113 [Pistacia integerrima]
MLLLQNTKVEILPNWDHTCSTFMSLSATCLHALLIHWKVGFSVIFFKGNSKLRVNFLLLDS